MSVLDASAVLAALQSEPGGAAVEQSLHGAHISAVNWCEVAQKLESRNIAAPAALNTLISQGVTVVPFDNEQAHVAADLYAIAKPFGLSLADRACMALGKILGEEILTADRIWADVPFAGVVRVIR